MIIINNTKKLLGRRKLLRKNMTKSEIALWSKLKNKQLQSLKFRRQHSVGPYIMDFYCPKLRLAIEIDGGQHNTKAGLSYDQKRSNYLNSLNIKVIRYWNNDVYINIEGVIADIINKIENKTDCDKTTFK